MKKFTPLLLAGLLASGPLFAQNLAKVNGVPIPSSRADAMVNQLASQAQSQGQQPNLAELRERVKDQLITYELISQEATKSGLTKQPDVVLQLDLARQNVLSRAYLVDYTKKNPPGDAEVQAKYDAIKVAQAHKEYLARNIVVKTEGEAKAIIAKLKGGAKFEDQAKLSIDPTNKDKGGLLEWSAPDSFDADFATAMVKLSKGQTSDVPVKSQYGWHVIRLEDVRDAPFPPLDQVRPRVVEIVQQEKVGKMLEDLRAKAKIE